MEVLSDGSADLANVYIAEIGVTIELPLEIPCRLPGAAGRIYGPLGDCPEESVA